MDGKDLLLQARRQVEITKAKEAGQEKINRLQNLQQGTEVGLLGRKYNYSGNPFTANMPVGFDRGIQGAVEAGEVSQNLGKKQKEAIRLERIAMNSEVSAVARRTGYEGSNDLSDEQIEAEQQLLNERIAAINASEEAALGDCSFFFDSKRKLEIRMKAAQDRAAAYGEFANIMTIGSQVREVAMRTKEEYDIKYNSLKKALKVENMTDSKEQKRERKTIRRHGFYDAVKAIFKKDNPLSVADAAYKPDFLTSPLINKERAFFGGTKPMYIFENRDRQIGVDEKGAAVYQKYLYKEAINCLGAATPDRALVTEAASKLQEYLFGSANAVKAFVAKDADGNVIGSFQEKIETLDSKAANAVDLFSWQAKPTTTLAPEVVAQVMREHTLDWLLCNFDTKGENFLQKQDGSLVSIDKEASFSKLKEAGAQHMSRTYQPHSNETIYNTMFRMYVEKDMPLDFDAAEQYITRMEQMSDADYLRLFVPMLDQKYGKASTTNMDRAKVVELLMLRKENLRQEYKKFYGSLVQERLDRKYKERLKEVKAAGGNTDLVLKERSDRVDANGNYIFASERAALQQQTPDATPEPAEATTQKQGADMETAVYKYNSDDDVMPVVEHLNEEAAKWKLDDKATFEYGVKESRGGDVYSVQATISKQSARLDKARRRKMENDVLAKDEAITHELGVSHSELNKRIASNVATRQQETRDPYHNLMGVVQGSYNAKIRAIVRADITGFEREQHIEQNAGKTVLEPETVELAKQDFRNLYENIYKDELIQGASSYEFPEEVMGKVYALYLARGYLEPLNVSYYTKNGGAYGEDLAKLRKENVEKYGHIIRIFKTDANAVTQLIEPYARKRALAKVKAMLDSNPELTEYEKEIERAMKAEETLVDEMKTRFDLDLAKMATTEKVFTKVDAMCAFYNREQINTMRENFAGLGQRLFVLDKKGRLTKDEQDEKRDIIVGIHKLVLEQPVGTRQSMYKIIEDNADSCVGTVDSLLARTDITLSEEQINTIQTFKDSIVAKKKVFIERKERFERFREDAEIEANFAMSEEPLRKEMEALQNYLKEQKLSA